ncbi:glutaredoxin family protein [Natronospora cellulosivora (SeqCode)]
MKLDLYYFPSCPFCKKVINYIKKNDIEGEVNYKNIRQDNVSKNELINKGGKEQVPCLFIDGEALYESDLIIKWLDDNIIKK